MASRPAWSNDAARDLLTWEDFLARIRALAARHADGGAGIHEVAEQAAGLLRRLDPGAAGLAAATAGAWESGNRFWFWQRLTRDDHMLGGILTVDGGQPVPLHDHPEAAGILRVLSGELEVWQYDAHTAAGRGEAAGDVMLQRVSYRRLLPGDIAVLRPDSGNVHALRSLTPQCRMLDFFIPPYRRRQRSWYQPLQPDWEGAVKLACRRIPEQDYLAS